MQWTSKKLRETCDSCLLNMSHLCIHHDHTLLWCTSDLALLRQFGPSIWWGHHQYPHCRTRSQKRPHDDLRPFASTGRRRSFSNAFDTCNRPAPSRLVGSAGCDSIRWSCQCQENLWWCTPRKIWQGQHHLPFQSLRSWRKDTFYAIDTHPHSHANTCAPLIR